ncbi:hypothetical protein K9U40_20930 [Xanthobacter autotrophicus]|uniref:hypothetical protein n=1 Tax=Xanthobacter TaxID=279 RepID=UPI0024ABF673|nr:hypothetical protein [Xanthobacter autotrophicus]MDI4666764.1 hypothetical protein [Xanthobacter autotrophicus]
MTLKKRLPAQVVPALRAVGAKKEAVRGIMPGRPLEHAPISLHRKLIGQRVLFLELRGRFTDQIDSI